MFNSSDYEPAFGRSYDSPLAQQHIFGIVRLTGEVAESGLLQRS